MILSEQTDREALRRDLIPHLGWPDLEPSTKKTHLERFLETIDTPSFPGALIPVYSRSPARVAFYAVADDGRQWRLLQPLLLAAVGMTLTTFDGRPLPALEAGGLESELKKRNLVASLLVVPTDLELAGKAVDALRRLVDLRARAPLRHGELLRSTAELLHAFDLAIGAGNQPEAQTLLDEINERQLLDVLNLHFLQVRVNSEFREWDRLAAQPWFEALAQTRRPPRVTAALVEALYQTQIAAISPEPVSAILEAFRSDVLPRAGELFGNLPPVRSAPVSVAYLLNGLASDDSAAIERVRGDVTPEWDPELRDVFERVLQHATVATVTATAEPPVDELAAIRQLLVSGAEVTKLELLSLLVGANNVGTLESQNLVRELAERIEDGASAELLPAEVIVPETRLPETWTEWFDSLETMDHAAARDIAQQAADEWSIAIQLESPQEVDRLTNAMSAALSGAAAQRASAAVPHLMRWVHNDELWPNPDLRVLYEDLFTALLLSDHRRRDTLAHALTLLDGLLAIGASGPQYVQLLGDLRAELRLFASTRTIDLFLDAAEILTSYPCPDEGARAACWAEVVSILEAFAPALSNAQRLLADDFGRILGARPVLPEKTRVPDAPPGVWDGLIGIYTLREDVGRRAEAVLRSVYPASRIQVTSEHVSSANLRHLAETADVLVVSWTAAKHAATDALKRARKQPILWVGGGASSIVSEVIQAVGELARG